MSDPELERDLERLRQAYGRKLPGLLDELESLLRRARRAGGQEPLEAARHLAHRLKGTSGSLGLDAASGELARIEQELDRLLGREPTDAESTWQAIERALGRAR